MPHEFEACTMKELMRFWGVWSQYIRDLGEKRLIRAGKSKRYQLVDPLGSIRP